MREPADGAHAQMLSKALCPWLQAPFTRLEQARVAGRLGHAWLLGGPRGIGKLNLALVMADRLLTAAADAPAPPVLTAAMAADALSGSMSGVGNHHPDLYRIHPVEDRQTISVEQLRELGAALHLKSLRGRTKVVVLEPAEAMTHAAANSFLKTLEEPTDDTFLWLVSHQPGRLPATIRSRCQPLWLPVPPQSQVQEWLGGRDGPSLDALTPLRRVQLNESEINLLNKDLKGTILALSRSSTDPMQVADDWMKGNVSLALEWLATELRSAIRARLTASSANRVTDREGDPLHNAWRSLSMVRLWAQLDATEQLQSRQGKGLNEDLALRALLLGFEAK